MSLYGKLFRSAGYVAVYMVATLPSMNMAFANADRSLAKIAGAQSAARTEELQESDPPLPPVSPPPSSLPTDSTSPASSSSVEVPLGDKDATVRPPRLHRSGINLPPPGTTEPEPPSHFDEP